MKLDAGQVAGIRERIRRLGEYLSKNDSFCGMLDGINGFGSTGVTDRLLSEQTNYEYLNYRNELLNMEYMLLNADYIVDNKKDLVIDLGSEFTVKFSDEEDEETYNLVEELIGKSSVDNYVSKDSDFAKSVLGKRKDDEFSYKAKSTGSIISGVITDIKKKSRHKAHFIKEEPYTYRCGRIERAKRKNKDNFSEEEKIILNSYTFSQKEILEQEIARLLNIGMSCADTSNLKRQLTYYRKLLKEASFVNPVDNNTIGIGTQFSIDIIRADECTITKRLEMINRACSFSETTDEFMERISTVGSMVYGLSEGDVFRNDIMPNFRNKSEFISGRVYDIDNSIDRYVTIDPVEYQKKKCKNK